MIVVLLRLLCLLLCKNCLELSGFFHISMSGGAPETARDSSASDITRDVLVTSPFPLYAYSLVAVSKPCKTIRTAKSSDQDIQSHHHHDDFAECNYIFHFVHLIFADGKSPLLSFQFSPFASKCRSSIRRAS